MKKTIIIFGMVLLTLIIGLIIFRNLSFKSEYIIIDMVNGGMEIEVPKYSFDLRVSDNNISIKSFQSNRIIKKQLDKIILSYKKITCDNNDYYYSEKDNYTIIDYGINDHFVFNTIYMKYHNYNFCDYLKLQEYTEKLNGYARMLTFGAKAEDNKKVSVSFIGGKPFNELITFSADLTVQTKDEILEKSEGTFIIENNKLTYTRTDISKQNDKIVVPVVSTFTIIENGVLQLDENYLSEYENEIILR